jgi:hypothetical protein
VVSIAGAQTLNVNHAGYTGAALFSSASGYTITGMAADGADYIYTLETDSVNFSDSTKLFRRSPLDGYSTATQLFDYGAPHFGTFVTVRNGFVYFGESSTGTIRRIATSGGLSTSLATVNGLYDLVIVSDSAGYISANPEGLNPGNRVYKFDLSLGTVDSVLNVSPDYSGPVAVDQLGRIVYGLTGFSTPANPLPTGLYAYTEAELAAGLGAGEVLMDLAHKIASSAPNGYLAEAGANGLWQTGGDTLSLVNLGSGNQSALATSPHSIGALDGDADTVFAAVTRYSGTPRSTVYRVDAIPEPGTVLFIGGAFALLLANRRRSMR